MPDVDDTHQVTRLLSEIADGKTSAKDELITAVYQQLRRIAHVRMAAERPDHTLQATGLVHEACLRLLPGLSERNIRNHYDFYGAAAEAMRRVLVDSARKRQTEKRGGGIQREPIGNVADLADSQDPFMVIALNEAFENLESESPERADVVRLRFFAGLTIEDTAKALGISVATTKRRWSTARAQLFKELKDL